MMQKFNRILHFTGIDSWPLLFNVLKGDLSLIGPKPEKPEVVKAYTESQRQVLSVRPGIWGPQRNFDEDLKNGDNIDPSNGQEYYRNHVIPERLKEELYYVHSKGLGKDIRVLADLLKQSIHNLIHEQLMKEAKSRNLFFPIDLLFVIFAYLLAYLLRFDWNVPSDQYLILFKSLPIVIICRMGLFYYFGFYKNLWKYLGVRDLLTIIYACTVSSILIITAIFLIGIYSHSRSIFLIDWITCIFFIGGSRLVIRLFNENVSLGNKIRKNVLIIDAGDVGEMLLRMLGVNGKNKYTVVGFIDDNNHKHGMTIHGVKVLGSCEDIPELVPLFRIDEVLIATVQLSSEEMRRILRYCKQAEVRHRIVPAVNDVLSGSVRLSKFRKVDISDLFGRQPVELDLSAIQNFLCGKRVLITGAGGSIGSELCRQIVEYGPDCLIMVDKNENYLHEIRCELDAQVASLRVYCSLSNITNERTQSKIFRTYKPEIVFHAAAHKHVPLSEENPEEAIWNNIVGTKVMASLARKFGVTDFVMVSTDKAVNPTSIMGVTKRCAELVVQAYSQKSNTKYVTVRFGNVLNSNGSVIPIFLKQIERGGPVTVTHPEVERYFMSISEAVQLILQAVTMGKKGEILFLDMGKSIRIVDLANDLIKDAGMKPGEDIQLKFTGLRPGEKLFEELVGRDEESIPTSHSSIKTLKSNHVMDLASITQHIEDLTVSGHKISHEKLIKKLQKIVPEYTPFIHTQPHQAVYTPHGNNQNTIAKAPLEHKRALALSGN